MGENSAIEWTDHTFNPWIGCTKVSVGPQGACEQCYAEKLARRLRVRWGAGAPRRYASERYWDQPVRWNARAEREGIRRRVFCASMADVFDNEVHQVERDWLWEMIEETPWLDWLLLTKRIGNARSMLPARWLERPHPNVWLGATVVNQEEADRDIPKLIATPAAVRFLSCEPLLGPIDLSCIPWGPGRDVVDDPSEGFDALRYRSGPHIDWIIVGGESGSGDSPVRARVGEGPGPPMPRGSSRLLREAGGRAAGESRGRALPACARPQGEDHGRVARRTESAGVSASNSLNDR